MEAPCGIDGLVEVHTQPVAQVLEVSEEVQDHIGDCRLQFTADVLGVGDDAVRGPTGPDVGAALRIGIGGVGERLGRLATEMCLEFLSRCRVDVGRVVGHGGPFRPEAGVFVFMGGSWRAAGFGMRANPVVYRAGPPNMERAVGLCPSTEYARSAVTHNPRKDDRGTEPRPHPGPACRNPPAARTPDTPPVRLTHSSRGFLCCTGCCRRRRA